MAARQTYTPRCWIKSRRRQGFRFFSVERLKKRRRNEAGVSEIQQMERDRADSWDHHSSNLAQAGFEIVPDPTSRFANHSRLIHPEGILGFTDANLDQLAKTFQDTMGC